MLRCNYRKYSFVFFVSLKMKTSQIKKTVELQSKEKIKDDFLAMREEQREEESISSYVASIEKSTTEDEIVETATKATSSSNIYSGFAELLSALEKKNSSKNEKSTRLLELFSFGTFEEYREKDTSLPKELNAKQIQSFV